MCFGNTKTTGETTKTETPPAWLTNAAVGNLDYAKKAQAQGFQAYDQPMVAGFSPQQQSSFGLGGQLGSSVSPFVGQTGSLISNYANAGPGSVSAPTISSMMSPYMNDYVMKALQPQIAQQDIQFANQNKGVDSAATMAGAFGDTGWGQLRGTTTRAQNDARSGLIGNAYNAAFNTAIGAGAQDVANTVGAQTTNANLRETALQRQLGGANALYGQGSGAATLENQFGAQQTSADQARLNAQYNEFLRQQYQDPQFRAQLMNQAITTGRTGAPITTTETKSAPDNSGYGMVGSVLGGIGGSFIGMPGLGATLGGSLGQSLGGMAGNARIAASGNPLAATGGAGLPYAADGGKVAKNRPVLVGERGPEMFVPGKDGVVVPNEIMAAAREKRAKKIAKKPADGLAAQLGIAA